MEAVNTVAEIGLPAAGPANVGAMGGEGFDVWGMLRRRKWLILFSMVVGFGLGYLYLYSIVPVFQSAASIMVIRVEPRVSGKEDPQIMYEDILPSQMLLARSPSIVRGAVEKNNLASLRTMSGVGDPVAAVSSGLSVTKGATDGQPIGRNNFSVFTMSYKGPDPEDCRTILDAVIDSYRSHLNETYKIVKEETIEQLRSWHYTVDQEVKSREAKYAEFRKRNRLLEIGSKAINPQDDIIQKLRNESSDLMAERIRIVTRIEQFEKSLKDGVPREALILTARKYVFGEKDGALVDGDRVAADGKLIQPIVVDRKKEEMFRLAAMDKEYEQKGYGAEHPLRKSIAEKKAMYEEYFKEEKKDEPAPKTAKVEKPKRDFLDTYLDSLRQDLIGIDNHVLRLTSKLNEEISKHRSIQEDLNEDSRLTDEITASRKKREELIAKLNSIDLVKDSGGYKTETVVPPGFGRQIEPKPTQVLMSGIAIGLLAGLVLAYVVELADKSFRTPEDIRSRLRMPVVGHIPVLDIENGERNRLGRPDSVVDPSIIAHHRPRSRMAEAYRGIRTGLFFSTRGEGHKVIQITSPDPGDGKTTLSSNLSVSIAQSGKKTILIDADLRRPRIHRLFGVGNNDVGLTNVISGEIGLRQAIQATEAPNLSVICCGPIPTNPSELLSTPRFAELLEILRKEYDYVIVDTPPLLAVTDPCAVAPRVDGVILTIRISKSSYASAIRASEMLSSLDARAIGVVVNGVGSRPEYGYGYAYRSNYSSGGGVYGSYGLDYRYGDYSYAYGEYYADESKPANGIPANGESRSPAENVRTLPETINS